MRRFLWMGLLLASMLFALWACENPFAPRNLVERLRPLAVKASPPECGLDGEVELEALVADPTGEGRELRFVWAVCLMELSSAASDIACPGPDSYVLPGEGPTSQLSMPDLLAWLAEQGFEMTPEHMPPGQELPKTIPLFIGFELRAGEELMRGIKRVTVRLDGEAPTNINPRLLGLLIDGVEVGDETPRIPAGSTVVMTPLADEASRDRYIPDGETEPQLEDFLFSWFSDAGEFKDERSILDVDSEGRPLDINEFTAPDELGPMTIWLLVRDARYGTDWMSWDLEIVEPLPVLE